MNSLFSLYSYTLKESNLEILEGRRRHFRANWRKQTMNYEAIERKKQKIGHWLQLGFYALVVLVVAAKVIPICWRMMT